MVALNRGLHLYSRGATRSHLSGTDDDFLALWLVGVPCIRGYESSVVKSSCRLVNAFGP